MKIRLQKLSSGSLVSKLRGEMKMKNITFKKLALIGFFILISCFFISFSVKFFFKIESDFLSASATLFAAFVAFLLFNDWREQYKIELFEKIRDRLHTQLNEVKIQYNSFNNFIQNNEIIDPILYSEKNHSIQNAIDVVIVDFFYYEKLIYKYKPKNLKIHCDPYKSIDDLLEILQSLNGNMVGGDVDKWKKDIKEYLNSDIAFKTIVNIKMLTNNDIQQIILYYLEDKRGF